MKKLSQEKQINIYYKYMNFRGIDELSDFHIRLSPPVILNDPFEGVFKKDLLAELKCKTAPEELGYINPAPYFMPQAYEGIKEAHKFLKNDELETFINQYGIVSLTKNNNNLLMWAHYANEHKGICVGFKETLFKDLTCSQKSKYEIETYFPKAVNYRGKRLDDDNAPNAMDKIRRITTKYFFTKSKDWKYENEHRCIIPMEHADRLVCSKNISNNRLIQSLQREINAGNISKAEKIWMANNYIYEGEGLKNLPKDIRAYNDLFFLKKICPSQIDSITIGCRVSVNELVSIVQMVEKPNSPFNHVKLYISEPDPNLFAMKILTLEEAEKR